jgi:hypothetical protein
MNRPSDRLPGNHLLRADCAHSHCGFRGLPISGGQLCEPQRAGPKSVEACDEATSRRNLEVSTRARDLGNVGGRVLGRRKLEYRRRARGSGQSLGSLRLLRWGVASAYVPAWSDRNELWAIDGDAVRWLGVILFVAGDAPRIWPVYGLGHRSSAVTPSSPPAFTGSFATRATSGCLSTKWWTDNRQRLLPTRTHRTRSGGLHLIFGHHDGLKCSTSRIARGADVRAEGGYIIWSPAGFPALDDRPCAPWPEEPLAGEPAQSPQTVSVPTAYRTSPVTPGTIEARICGLLKFVHGAPIGERYARL